MLNSDTYNKVTLVAYLEAEPTYKTFGQNTSHAILSVFTRCRVKKADSTDYTQGKDKHRVVVKNDGLIENVVRNIGEGSHVLIEGKLKTRSWKDKDSGEWRYITEIIVSGMDCKLQLISDNQG